MLGERAEEAVSGHVACIELEIRREPFETAREMIIGRRIAARRWR
jgi:hypothetical protein